MQWGGRQSRQRRGWTLLVPVKAKQAAGLGDEKGATNQAGAGRRLNRVDFWTARPVRHT